MRKETTEQLDLFRKQQEQAQNTLPSRQFEASPIGGGERWTANPKKRKREKEAIPGVRLRKPSSGIPQEKDISSQKALVNVSENRHSSGKQEESQHHQTQGIPSTSQDLGTAPASPSQAPDDQSSAFRKVSSVKKIGGGLGLGDYLSDEDT